MYTTVSEEFQQHVRKLRTTGTAFRVTFNKLDECRDVNEYVEEAFGELLNRAFQDAQPSDDVGVEIQHPGLNRPVIIPFRKRYELTPSSIVGVIQHVQQSRERFHMDNEMVWLFTRVADYSAGVRGKKVRGNFDAWIQQKSGGHN